MRLVTWNCASGYRRKIPYLLALKPDLLVVQECDRLSFDATFQDGMVGTWIGSNPKGKGLGIAVSKDFAVHQLSEPLGKWVAPFQIEGKLRFNVMGVWDFNRRAKTQKPYGQLKRALIASNEFFNGSPWVIIGDLNNNAAWDKERKENNHSNIVAMLEERGLKSAYHHFYKEVHGKETLSTYFYQYSRSAPFHIDYCYIPIKWLQFIKSVIVGTPDEWMALSDHCPVIVDLHDEIYLGTV